MCSVHTHAQGHTHFIHINTNGHIIFLRVKSENKKISFLPLPLS
jgi:hypothetical protein